MITTVVVGGLLLAAASVSSAQDRASHDATSHDSTSHDATIHEPPSTTQWTWRGEGHVVFGFNAQERKFRDFHAWESQNWFMADGQRVAGAGTLSLLSMFSLEPFTERAIGSPQVFQTGETFRGAPLIDYQHPHDLFMGLGAQYEHRAGQATIVAGLHAVGSPAIGPTAFMHRPSAIDNPQAPQAHHYSDSTHITPGVVTGGVGLGAWKAEGSWFHGREPDERRTDIDVGALDSWSARLSWTRNRWSAQASGAPLTLPELTSPYDAQRITASLSYASSRDRPRVAWLALFGQNREVHGNFEAYLLEDTVRPTSGHSVFLRAESVAKDILNAGFHPRGVFHRHRQSQVGALTAGYVRDLGRTRLGPLGAGADATGYLVPANLRDSYGSPISIHVFVRLHMSPVSPATHERH